MNSRTRLLLALLLPITTVGWMACGGGKETAAPQSAASQALPTEQSHTASGETFCDHLSTAEISEALGGSMELGEPEGTETGCRVPILFGADGNALAFGQIPRGNYDAFKGYEDQSNVAFEYLEGLGQEAFVLNNAQVCVLMNESDAYLVGAQIVAVGEPLPIPPEELKAGLIEVTTKLVAQL